MRTRVSSTRTVTSTRGTRTLHDGLWISITSRVEDQGPTGVGPFVSRIEDRRADAWIVGAPRAALVAAEACENASALPRGKQGFESMLTARRRDRLDPGGHMMQRGIPQVRCGRAIASRGSCSEKQLACPLVRRARLACFRGPRPRALRRPSSTRVLHTQNLRCRRHTHDTHTEPPLLHTRSLPTHAHTHCLTGECGTHHGGGASSRGSVPRIPSFFLPASRCVSQRKRPAGE